MHELEKVLEAVDAAWSREDIEAVLESYDDDAILMVKPGLTVQGKVQIRKALSAIFAFFNHTLSVKQREVMVLEGGDTALVLATTIISGQDESGQHLTEERKATYVFRNNAGSWRCVIDNSYGVDLLG